MTLTRIILIAVFSAGVFYTLNQFLAEGQLSARENMLLGIQLTVCSTLASWLVTHFYAGKERRAEVQEVQEHNQANLRMYGLKAAEKLNNLSNELERLSIYLEEELNFTDYSSIQEELSAKEERIESAIHMIRTLKSVNDTSLSDWQGVIGEELDEQKKERIEKEERLTRLIDEAEQLIHFQRGDLLGSYQSAEDVRREVNALKYEMRNALVHLGGPTLLAKEERRGKREDVSLPCPSCGTVLKYRQRSKPSSYKSVGCDACHSKLVARYHPDKGHYLEVRRPVEETVSCAECGASQTAWVDNFPGANANMECSKCHKVFKVVRGKDGVTASKVSVSPNGSTSPEKSGEVEISDEFLQKVQKALPPQPWPHGAHKAVATDLGVDVRMVRNAIDMLIERGVFKVQMDGKLYLRVAPSEVNSPAKEKVDESQT